MKTVWIANKQDVIDTLVGAGAETYEWYLQLDETHDGQIICEMETGAYEPDKYGHGVAVPLSVEVTFTTSDAKAMVNEIIKEKKAGWQVVQSAVDADDFDSDAVDVVLQHIVLGDLVFG